MAKDQKEIEGESLQRAPYSNFALNSEEIRLCSIEPRNERLPISCKLGKVKLSEAGTYKCLSYVWGASNRRDPIILLDGVAIQVTNNLLAALKCLHMNEFDGLLWIDAICVDQICNKEKEEQVPLMAAIYRRAEEVLVWLGEAWFFNRPRTDDQIQGGASEDEDDISEALEFLRGLADNKHFHELPYFQECNSSGCTSQRQTPERSWRSALNSMHTLMGADWFKRTWVIQEIVLAKRATILYNNHKISWSLLEDAWLNWNQHLNGRCGQCIRTLHISDFQAVHQYAGTVLDFIGAQQIFLPAKSSPADQALQESHPLLWGLLKFRSKGVTNRRDKIYGLLGLQPSHKAIPVSPNYSSAGVDPYVTFAIEMYHSLGWMAPLHFDLHQKFEDLPSWVPDWTFTTDDPSDYAVARFAAALKHDSSKGLFGDVEFEDRTTNSKDRSIMKAVGIEVDFINVLSEPYHLKNTTFEQIVLIDSWRQFSNLHRRGDEEYVTGGTVGDALYHALFEGLLHDDSKCQKLSETNIASWKADIEDQQRKLREEGPNVALDLHAPMSSHFIACLRRRLCITTKGYIGVCPDTCEIGDQIFVLCQCKAPIFLRAVGPDQYTALGHGYVHGLMNGEAVQMGLSKRQVLIE